MNKLLTNEGGQPVFLDDLLLLQTTSWDIMKCLLLSMTGKDSGFLLNELEFSTSISPNATLDDRGYATIDGVTVTISPNSIVYQGNIIPFASGTFSITDIEAYGGIKVGIRITRGDNRAFEDGQERACREEYSAFLYVGEANADMSYTLYDLECLTEIVARRTGLEQPDTRWKQMPVVFYNGYSGSVRYTEGSTPRLKVHVRSSNTAWAADDPNYNNQGMFVGLVGVILDASLRTTFSRMKTKEMTEYYLLRPDGIPASSTVKSLLETTEPRGKIVIDSIAHYFDEDSTEVTIEQRGYLPPCQPNDAFGEVIAYMYEEITE